MAFFSRAMSYKLPEGNAHGSEIDRNPWFKLPKIIKQ